MARNYYCSRCGCTMDSGEGINYPGEGRVCAECEEALDLEADYRKKWFLTKEQLREIKRDMPSLALGGDGMR